MKRGVLLLAVVLILVALIVSTWYLFFRSEKCFDSDCFYRNFGECSRASYLDTGEWTYKYTIKGIVEEECMVDVKLIFAGMETKFKSIVGESMRCSIPLRKIDLPWSDLEYCTGPLKENIQYLVIKDLYQYASQNLGKKDD